MNFSKLSLLVQLAVMSIFVCGLHFLMLSVSSAAVGEFYYTPFQEYLFLIGTSIAVYGLNTMVAKKSFEQLGFVFLGVMTVKFILAYVFVLPLLDSHSEPYNLEKKLFFLNFILFLGIDVYLTSQILTSSGKKDKKE